MAKRPIMAALLCAGLVTACSHFAGPRSETPPVVPEIPVRHGDILSPLLVYQALASAPRELQRQEWLTAGDAFAGEASDRNRLRLLLALLLPAFPWRDENRLLAVLENPSDATPEEDATLQQLNVFLYKLVKERQRVHEDQGRREAELQDEQRRNAALQMKLDALRRIDQDLRHRKQPPESIP